MEEKRIADRLTDILFAADDVFEMLAAESCGPLLWLEPPLRRVASDVDRLLRRICH